MHDIVIFLQKAVVIDNRDNEGKTPLHLACEAVKLEAVKVLVEASELIFFICNQNVPRGNFDVRVERLTYYRCISCEV